MTKFYTFLLYFLVLGHAFSQHPNHKGYTYFSKYSKSLISPERSQKHIFSIGTGISGFSTEAFPPPTKITDSQANSDPLPLLRVGIGYHYFFLKSKRLTFYKKERFEHTGFSVYVNAYLTQIGSGIYKGTRTTADTINILADSLIIPQNELRLTYTNPFISYRGKIFNFYLIHEYGLSLFRSSESPFSNAGNNLKLYGNIVPLSIKLGQRPIYLKTSINFSLLDSKLLQFRKVKANAGIELQIYFYKSKK